MELDEVIIKAREHGHVRISHNSEIWHGEYMLKWGWGKVKNVEVDPDKFYMNTVVPEIDMYDMNEVNMEKLAYFLQREKNTSRTIAEMIGRAGGMSKSERKILAARENGKKGGRPKGEAGK